MAEGFTCTKCGKVCVSENGLKKHYTMSHGGYSQEELFEYGITPSRRDIARNLDAGHSSIDDAVNAAPDTEGASRPERERGTRTRRSSKEEREQAAESAEFERLRPQLVKRWKRRLRVPYSLWARLANDPQVALTDDEAEEGAEMHVDFCQAMGWLRAGKIEAVIDLTMWHGATILARSNLGQSLMGMFEPKEPEDVPKPN